MITKLQKLKFFDEPLIKQRDYDHLSLFQVKNKRIIKQKIFKEEEKIRIVIDGQSNTMPLKELCLKEGISLNTFNRWTKEYLKNEKSPIIDAQKGVTWKPEDKYRIVIEGKTGETSIAEICRRENISQDTFLEWIEEFILLRNRNGILHKLNSPIYQKNKNLISSVSGIEVFKYGANYIDMASKGSAVVLESDDQELDRAVNLENIVVLEKINNVRFINKYFERVNSKLENGGVFMGCLETFSARKERMKISKILFLNNVYFAFEFIVKRILPKISFTKKYYFDITKGNDRLLSKAEGLGRLVSCGFSIMDFKSIEGLTYFVVKKIREPYFDENPSYGPLYKMPRLGKNGEMIGVYKFRTMHPYSEYLQDYIVNAHGYASTGKPENDFRIPKWGKFMRRFWLDELPQLLNVVKGDMKLVGIRPVSKRYFQDIPSEMQKLRLTQKPGCVPPYVALNRESNVMSVLQSEKEYLQEKIRNPYTTDIKYFLSSIFNIIFNHKRSA